MRESEKVLEEQLLTITLLRRYQIAKRCRPDVSIRFNSVEVYSGQDEKRGEYKKREKGYAFFYNYCRISRCTRVAPSASYVTHFKGECGRIFRKSKKKCDAKCQALTPPIFCTLYLIVYYRRIWLIWSIPLLFRVHSYPIIRARERVH
jgi:hypothetical protein